MSIGEYRKQFILVLNVLFMGKTAKLSLVQNVHRVDKSKILFSS